MLSFTNGTTSLTCIAIYNGFIFFGHSSSSKSSLTDKAGGNGGRERKRTQVFPSSCNAMHSTGEMAQQDMCTASGPWEPSYRTTRNLKVKENPSSPHKSSPPSHLHMLGSRIPVLRLS